MMALAIDDLPPLLDQIDEGISKQAVWTSTHAKTNGRLWGCCWETRGGSSPPVDTTRRR